MIQFAGQFFLICAICFALAQGFIPLIGYAKKNPYLLAFARPCAYGQCFFVLAAYLYLTISFYNNDFSILYVALNSHPDLPLMYKLTALWGAHEGSILLWILILNIWTVCFSIFEKQYKSLELVLAILGIIGFAFLCFLYFTSNPFILSDEPMRGQDLNPLLQDPGFVSHPPMLYAGYVGFSVAFAITLAALIEGHLNNTWAQITRRFAIAAWSFLTLGILLGSLWAYKVLGWGGFWFWDPVENASLLPWLSGTALIHILILIENRNIGKAWGALLAIISFGLSLLGTFLVRSGVLISAHSFASDPSRGIFLLLLLAILTIIAVFIFLIRFNKSTSSTLNHFSPISRETSLLLNSCFLFIAMLTVLLGTIYPLILDALHLGIVSVGAPYFNKVMMPLVWIIMFFMGLAPHARWQHSNLLDLWSKSWKNILFSNLLSALLLWGVQADIALSSFFSLSLSIWIILGMLPVSKILPGMTLAHIGFAILIIGIMLSSLLSQEREVKIKPGNSVALGPYQFFFLDTKRADSANFKGIRGTFDVFKNKYYVTQLYPEKRIYSVRQTVMSKVDIHPSIFRDLYLALGEPLDNDYWSVRLYYKPFIRWIWLGGLIMMLGGFIAIRKNIRQNHAL